MVKKRCWNLCSEKNLLPHSTATRGYVIMTTKGLTTTMVEEMILMTVMSLTTKSDVMMQVDLTLRTPLNLSCDDSANGEVKDSLMRMTKRIPDDATNFDGGKVNFVVVQTLSDRPQRRSLFLSISHLDHSIDH